MDMLEKNVPDKYTLSDKAVKYITAEKRLKNNWTNINPDVAITLTAKGQNNWTGSFIRIREATKKGYDEAYEGDGLNLSFMNGTSRRGRVKRGMSPTLPAKPTTGCVDKNLRLRKLTPKEYFRLMGFDDYDFEKACQVNSDSQLYKQAGNSIVVNVLEAILKNLLIEDDVPSQKEIFEKTDSGQLKGQMNIFDFLRG